MDENGAFDELVRAASPRLQRTCYLLTGDPALGEDLLRAAFARTYLRWGRGTGDGEAYAYGVAARTAARWWRRPPVAGASGLRGALLGLTPGQRAVVVLRFLDGLSEDDAAAALGTTAGVVRRRTARALARLRRDPEVAALLDDELVATPQARPA